MVRVSVLIPVYNAVPYLHSCLETLQKQTAEGLEFICIDDGSTDESLSILKSAARTDNRFRVYHQDNAGYGAAMNHALDLAQGDYLGIVEPDDFVEPSMFESLYTIAVQRDCDVVKSNRFNYAGGKDTFVEDYAQDMCNYLFCPLEDQRVFLKAPASWTGIYRRSLIEQNSIRYLETPGASFQDTGFMFKVLACAEKAFLTHDAYYHYRRDNESSSVANASKVFCVNDEYTEMDRFLSNYPEREGKLRQTYARMRFQTYRWNYKRIDWLYRYAFLLRASEEFKKLDEINAFNRALFSDDEWNKLQYIITDVDDFFQLEASKHHRGSNQVAAIKQSNSYRIGRAVTALPRAIKRILG